MTARYLPHALAAVLITTLTGFPLAGSADSTEEESGLEVVVVTGVRSRDPLTITSSEISRPGLDNSDVLRLFPGGNRNANGPLTRISQYRGLFGAQNNVAIDGLSYTAGGPNWMDSPLSSIPQSLTGSVTLYRGLGSVDVVEEGLGGAIRIESLQGDYSKSDGWAYSGRAGLGWGSNASALGAAAFLGLHGPNDRLDLAASHDQGDDYEFDGGTAAATEFDRKQFRLAWGHRFEQAEVELGAVINRTGDSGTPALPMDIRYVDSEQYRFGLESSLGPGRVTFRINTLDVDHLMDNFTLRPPPLNLGGMPVYRQTVALGEADTLKLDYGWESANIQWEIGVDGKQENHDAEITNPKNERFYITNFNAVERDRAGLYLMATATAGGWGLEGGLRYNRVRMDAGEVGGDLAPMNPMMQMQQERLDELAEAFNRAQRRQSDDQWSGLLKTSREVADGLRFDAGLGRKVRSPSYQERYLWLPMEATAGLADGFTYIGDIHLKPERSTELTAGLDWNAGRFRLTPEAFWRDVRDYIQGVPSSNEAANRFAMMMSGRMPLQFANVDAELYGLDLGYEWRISEQWNLAGVLSYVRGKRTDVDDNLYRIAPLSSFLELAWSTGRYRLALESVAAARQDRVAEFNREQETPGWGIANLRAAVALGGHVKLDAGIENLFDKACQDHLGGYNRVRGSDIPLGTRMYNMGRNFYLRVNAHW